jgi:hypothetical protein
MSEYMLVNPQRSDLVHSGYARVYFAHSVVVCGFKAMGAVYARRMFLKSEWRLMPGLRRRGTLTIAPIIQIHNCIAVYQG